jgi:hypothetical protein
MMNKDIRIYDRLRNNLERERGVGHTSQRDSKELSMKRRTVASSSACSFRSVATNKDLHLEDNRTEIIDKSDTTKRSK